MDTYRRAGVDLAAAAAVVDRIGGSVTATWRDDVVGGFGGFAAGIRLPAGYRRPVLMMVTDGVGTKAELARRTGLTGGLGADLVAMCVDDLVAAGARPLAMTDYVAVGSIDVEAVAALVGSIAAACAEAGVALLGGETAEHPGVLDPEAFDLAGAAVGIVEEGREVDGSGITPGDVIIGVRSPNLRANGFSLVRRVFDGVDLGDPMPGGGDATVAETILAPSIIYTPAIVALLEQVRPRGMAHITGGGLRDNIARILPGGCEAVIDTGSWEPPPVFAAVAEAGGVDRDEMFAVFNMGIGFVVVTGADDTDDAVASLAASGREADVIGAVVPGDGTVRLT
jgi:phosphoribosylformylglycinamidine cyclo-ligase